MGFCFRARAGCSARWPCSAPIGIALAVRECPEVRICTCSGGPRMAASRRAGSQPFADGRLTTLSTAWMTMGASSRGRRFSSAFRRKASFRGSDILRRRRGKAVLSRGRQVEERGARRLKRPSLFAHRGTARAIDLSVLRCALRSWRAADAMDAAHAQAADKRCFARVLALPYEDKPGEFGLAQKRPAWADASPGCSAP